MLSNSAKHSALGDAESYRMDSTGSNQFDAKFLYKNKGRCEFAARIT